MKPPKLNDKGQTTLVFALAFAVVSCILILQMGAAYNYINNAQYNSKITLNNRYALIRLGMQVKQAYDRAQISANTCTGFDKVKIGAQFFCFPPGGQPICVDMPVAVPSATPMQGCLSRDPAALELSPSGISGLAGVGGNVPPNAGPVTTSTIVVPSPGPNMSSPNAPWRTCGGTSVCVRLSLCPIGVTTCTASEAIAMQVLRIENVF